MNFHSHHSPTIYQSNIVKKFFYNQKPPDNSSLSYLSKLAQFKKMQTGYNFSPNNTINNIDLFQINNTNNLLSYQENSNNLDISYQLTKSMINICPFNEKNIPNINFKKIYLNNFNSMIEEKNRLIPNANKEEKSQKIINEINNKNNYNINNDSQKFTQKNSQFLQYNEHSRKYKLIDAINKIKKVRNTHYYINTNNSNSNSNDHYQNINESSLNDKSQKSKKQLGNMAKLFSSFKTFQSSNSVIYCKENSDNNNSNNNINNTINNTIINKNINFNDNKTYKTSLRKIIIPNIKNSIGIKNSEKNYMNNLVIRTVQSGENSPSQTNFDKFHSYERVPLINISDRSKKQENNKTHNLSSSGNLYKKLNLKRIKNINNFMRNSQNKKIPNMIFNEKGIMKYKKPYINKNNSTFLANSHIINMPNFDDENLKYFDNKNQYHDEKNSIYKKNYLETDVVLNETNPKRKLKIYQKKQLKVENNKYKNLTNLSKSNDKINFITSIGGEGEYTDFSEMISLDRRETILMSKVKNRYSFYEKKYGFSVKKPKFKNCYLTKNILKIFKKNILPLKYISKSALFKTKLPVVNKTIIKKKIYKKNYIKPEKTKNKQNKVIIHIIKRKKKKKKENPIKYFTKQKKYIKTQNELLLLNNKNTKNEENKNYNIAFNTNLLNNEKIISILTEDLENYIDYKNNSSNNKNYDWSITEQVLIKLKLTLPEIIYYYIQIAQSLIDTIKKMNFANSYILNILRYYINNYIDSRNFLEIHNKIVDLFENFVRNNDINDDENNFKYDIIGGVFYELIKNELFFVSDLNRFVIYENNEKLIINIANAVRYIIMYESDNCSLYEEFNNSAIFKNKPIFYKYVTKTLKIYNFKNLKGKY